MSELRANTITASNGTGPVTLTKQEATKFWVTYDSRNDQVEGSLNQSGLIDETVGRYYSTFTSAFGSATDKCAVTCVYNSYDNASAQISSSRGGIISNIGVSSNAGTFRALSASEIQYCTNYGSTAGSNGDEADYRQVYVMAIGDLA